MSSGAPQSQGYDPRIERLFTVLLIGLFLLLVIVTASVIIERATNNVREEVNHALELERDLGALYGSIQGAETGQRGYLLTRDNDYLAPYRSALDSLPAIFERIDGEVTDNPTQHRLVRQLHELSLRKFRELSSTVALMGRGDTARVREIVRSDYGQELMDSLQRNIQTLRDGELRAIEDQRRRVEELTLITTVLRFLAFAGLLFVLYYINSQVRPLVRELNAAIQRRDAEIEERVRIEAVNAKLIASLHHKNQELDQFSRVVSHDLREPLRTVSNFVEVLEEDHLEGVGAEGRRHLDFIKRATERMRSLIDTLLNYASLGRSEAASEVDLNEVLREVRENLALTISESGTTVLTDELPTVLGYPVALCQLFQNLVANGIKYRRPGVAPVVRVTAETRPDHYRVAVADNGIGISEADRDRIFGAFTRLEPARQHEGHGIGLAFCRKIAELHGGHIEVSSIPGEGSIFTVSLLQQFSDAQ